MLGDEEEPSETDDKPGGGAGPEDSSVELTGPAGLVTIHDDSNGGVRYTFDPDHPLYAELKKLA